MTVTFSEGVYSVNDGTGALDKDDFNYPNANGTGADHITSVSHLEGEAIAVLTLDVQVLPTDTSGTPDEIAVASGTAIYDSASTANAATTTAVAMLDFRNALSLVDGWNLVSIPKVADATWDIATSNATGTFDQILTYDNGLWSNPTGVDSLDAVFIDADGPQELTLLWTTDEEAMPPTKALEVGWNLLGANMDPTMEIDVQGDLFLNSVSTSYSTLFSPDYNLNNWTVVVSGSWGGKNVLPYEGYWLYMTAADELAGRTS